MTDESALLHKESEHKRSQPLEEKKSQSTHHENTGKLLQSSVLYMLLLHTLYFTRITAIQLAYYCLTSHRTCSIQAAPAHALLGFTRRTV